MLQIAFVQLWGLPVPKIVPVRSWTKKSFFSQVNKYPEAETWYPENIDGWSYYRLCDNFWFFDAVPWGNLDSIWYQKIFFCLALQELCNFSRTCDLRHLILLKMQFLQNFWCSAIFFGFQTVNWTPEK